MEDEGRPLPKGWLRQFDAKENHQFFVNTNVEPPTSMWQHPYDDEDYLKTLSSEERERIQEEQNKYNHADYDIESSDEQHHDSKADSKTSTAAATGAPAGASSSSSYAQLPPRPSDRKKSTSEKLKEKLTGQTKEQRAAEKAQRAREEQEAYRMHQQVRQAMVRAEQTGQPQFIAKDQQGRDVFMEPPMPPPGYNYGPNGYGYNPYSSGPYQNPNNRFVQYPRPNYAYGRPYGYGYGSGLGLPIAGGLLGGALLGGLLF